MTAPADLEPPKGLGLGLGSGLGLSWSGSTCKVEIDGTRPAQSFVQDAAAHSGHRNLGQSNAATLRATSITSRGEIPSMTSRTWEYPHKAVEPFVQNEKNEEKSFFLGKPLTTCCWPL